MRLRLAVFLKKDTEMTPNFLKLGGGFIDKIKHIP